MPDWSLHLCLLAGADNRHAYLRDTIHLCQPWFREIHLVDTGSTDETESLGQLQHVRYHRLVGWKDDWPLAYSRAIHNIPDGDWFLFLDSDERPSQHLLDHLATDVTELEAAGLNCAYLPGMLHLSGHPEVASLDLKTSLTNWPATHEVYLKNPCFTKRILVKLLPITYICANGGHCAFFQGTELSRYLPRFYNHYKSAQEVAASTVLCSWSCLESYDVPKHSAEWERHNSLRQSTGLLSASDFLRVAQAGELPREWLDFWRTLEHSSRSTLAEYWKFAFQYEFSTTVAPSFCGWACCRYQSEQL